VYKFFDNTSIFISGLELSKASFKRQHTIKDKDFRLHCMCLVGPGLFILGSYSSPRLILFDTTEMKPVAHQNLHLDEIPYNVCLIPGDKVAMTGGWSNTIVIVSEKNNQLQREHDIHIDCEPLCITSYKEDLFVITVNVINDQMSIRRVTLTGDIHMVCDLSNMWRRNYPWWYSMTTSKECKPKIYVACFTESDVLEVSLDGSTLRSISMPRMEGGIIIKRVASVGENTLCLFSEGKRLILADIMSEKTSTVMKKKQWWFKYLECLASACPVTKTLLIWDPKKDKIKVFKWK